MSSITCSSSTEAVRYLDTFPAIVGNSSASSAKRYRPADIDSASSTKVRKLVANPNNQKIVPIPGKNAGCPREAVGIASQDRRAKLLESRPKIAAARSSLFAVILPAAQSMLKT
eukprot:CAMPEP_0173246684 /NCGR_PEP_ID=MMETSP1142-20121109/17465_1 /TAXON_ID=483371 /ORGANISM="non described non described, Strain CCMP2298" /LENGTH=113 /DNA_ID=CAMNT_0014178957 /DNA_START=444 /DNA_END=783 /DNA_ORIENTATION=+